MVSRAELLRAHRFIRRRIINAVESGNPDAEPSRRGTAVTVGIVVSLLAVGAVAAQHYSNRPPQWRRADAVIVDRDTGAHYVYVAGVLHSVANYASARLALGMPSAHLVTVSRGDLQGAATGPAWGIVGAPNSLPAASDLVTSWTVCSDEAGAGSVLFDVPVGGQASSGVIVANEFGQKTMIVGDQQAPYPGDVLPQAVPSKSLLAAIPVVAHVHGSAATSAPGTLCAINDGGALHVVAHAKAPRVRVALPNGKAALVQSDVPSSPVELIVDGVAYPVKGSDALASLGLAGAQAMTVPTQVLSLVPHGVELSRAAVVDG